MTKKLLFLLSLSVLVWTKSVNGQCPSLSVSATEVCSAYNGFCGCQISNVEVSGSLPANYWVSNTKLLLGGFPFPAGQTITPCCNTGWTAAFFGTFPSYTLRNDYLSGGPYVLELTMTNGSNTMVCYYSFNVPINNAAASPNIVTHYITVPQLESGLTAPTTVFYHNEPISFDGTSSTETIEYTLSCTRVNQSGVAIGSTVTTTEFFSPESPIIDFGFQNLRYLFSNLIDPTGMELNRYYKIEMHGIGCNNQTITTSKIIRINAGARVVKIRSASLEMVEGIYPNPGNGKFQLNLTEEQEHVVVRVFNVEGQLVHEETLKEFTAGNLDLSALRDGVYTLHLESDSYTTIEKIIIAH